MNWNLAVSFTIATLAIVNPVGAPLRPEATPSLVATALLEKNTSPNDSDINAAMSGNVCRCSTYVRIRAGIHRAAEKLEG